MRSVLLLSFLLGFGKVSAQSISAHLEKLHQDLKDSITFFKVWNHRGYTIPYVSNDSVLFLYYGKATKVEWMGDFNGWGYDKSFRNKGVQLDSSDLWYLRASFPSHARLDYKILVDGNRWLLDPLNPHQQWSGVGGGSPNSELRMPEWKEDEIQAEIKSVAKGTVKPDLLFNSKILSYQITYDVYLPAGYHTDTKYPVVYVTDGYEYMHPKLGNMITVLDNLIATGKIKPVIAIFIDHREPINRSNNKRMTELAMNNNYYNFISQELVPFIESAYAASGETSNRAIMGTSMGGLAATYFAFSPQSVFGMAGIQSPAFWTQPRIYELCKNPENPALRVSMTTGTINDTFKETQKMKEILSSTTCQFTYREVPEGHSWGNWRNLIDDILLDFFKK
jgi:enterochelin esterase-like enzyme